MSIKKKIGWGVIVLGVISVVSLPVVLSSSFVQKKVIERINADKTGELRVERCQIGWQKRLECQQIGFDDPARGLHVEIPLLTGSQGLFALLVAPKNFGTVEITDPVVVLSEVPAKETSSPAGSPEKRRTPVSPSAPQDTLSGQESHETPVWENMMGILNIQRAVIKQKLGDSAQRTLIREGNLKARLNDGTVHFGVDLNAGAQASGSAVVSGFINLPARSGTFIDTLVTEVNLHILDLQLGPFFALLARKGNMPDGDGRLSSELLIKTAGLTNVTIHGTSQLRNLELAGGMLGDDHPVFQQINMDVDVQRQSTTSWKFSGITLTSDVGTLEMTGTADQDIVYARTNGDLNLPELFTQFPHLLKVKKDTSLQDGLLHFVLDVKKHKQRLDTVIDVQTNGVTGYKNGRLFAWKNPLSSNLSMSLVNGEPLINSLSVKAPFLDLQGQGNLKTFALKGTADLDQATKEFGTLFDFGWNGAGQLRLQAGSKQEGPKSYVVDSQIDISGFSLSRQGKLIMPTRDFSFSGQVQMKNSPAFPVSRQDGLKGHFKINAWPGKVQGKFADIYKKNDHLNGSYQLGSTLQLGRLVDMMHNMDLAPDTTLIGKMDVSSSGFFNETKLVVNSFDSKIKDFIFYHQGKRFRDPLVHVRMQAVPQKRTKGIHPLVIRQSFADYFSSGRQNIVVDTATHAIQIYDTDISTHKGELSITELTVNDWKKPVQTMRLKASGKGDLAQLTPVFRQYGVLKKGQSLAGSTTFSVKMAPKTVAYQAGSLQLDFNHMTAEIDEKKLFTDQKVSAKGAFQLKTASGDVIFDTLNLQAAPIIIQASGKLQKSGKNPALTLTGTLQPDFKELANIVNAMKPLGIEASGGTKEALTLIYPLGEPSDTKMNLITLMTALKAKQLAAYGVDIQDFTMSVSLGGGKLKAPVSGTLYNGALQVSPSVDFTGTPSVTLPAGEQILTDVELEKPLVDLFQRITPLLGLLTSPSGKISTRIDSFSWPLIENGANLAAFVTVLDLSKITLVADGVMSDILQVAGLGDEPLSLAQSEIICTGAQGKITCTPLKILVAGSAMTLSGTVGFNGSIDYLLEVPVTRKLVGAEGFRILEGTTLMVPIKGDHDRAFFDREALTGAVSDLLQQAARKAGTRFLEKQVDKIVPGLLDTIIGK